MVDDQTRHVRSIFQRLAPKYDLANRLLSFGRDVSWRRFAVQKLLEKRGSLFLDVAAGTCDVGLELVRANPTVRVVAVDFTYPMLAKGNAKIARASQMNRIHPMLADGLSLPFDDASFDGAIIAFGMRNILNRGKALREMGRVVTSGGLGVVLEFTFPERSWFRPLYLFYLNRLLPRLGGLLSKSGDAHEYLSDSIMQFPRPEVFGKMMEDAGFMAISFWPLTFGIVVVYSGERS